MDLLSFFTYASLPDLVKVAGESWGIGVPSAVFIPGVFVSFAAIIGAIAAFRLWCFPPYRHRLKLLLLLIFFILFACVNAICLGRYVISTESSLMFLVTLAPLIEALLAMAFFVVLLFFRNTSVTHLLSVFVGFLFGAVGIALLLGGEILSGLPQEIASLFGYAFITLMISYAVILTHRLCELSASSHAHENHQTS